MSSQLNDLNHAESDVANWITPTWRAYLALTKPRIIELLLVTTIPTMFLAAGGFPEWQLVCWTLLGGSLAAGGANVLNCYLDRDIDAMMHRTANRPSATGQISGPRTITFGLVLSALSVLVLGVTVNLLSAALAAFAIAFYVIGYTMLLKRRTSQNIVWGGAAGCMPVLIGWSAVTGSLSWTPVVLFLIVFFWTPPHYWPLSLRYKDDYAAAGVPMLPVTDTPQEVAKQIIIYSWVMVATTLALIPVADMNWLYSIVAITSGALFIYEAYALRTRVRKELADLNPMRLFHWSISYLSLVFLAIGIDPFL
ncbi:MAG: heme o synthase [Candidatus Nanopelagicales bacterium]|nr:heme o synthase [Candidatus Nanopelagicales bacterium]